MRALSVCRSKAEITNRLTRTYCPDARASAGHLRDWDNVKRSGKRTRYHRSRYARTGNEVAVRSEDRAAVVQAFLDVSPGGRARLPQAVRRATRWLHRSARAPHDMAVFCKLLPMACVGSHLAHAHTKSTARSQGNGHGNSHLGDGHEAVRKER